MTLFSIIDWFRAGDAYDIQEVIFCLCKNTGEYDSTWGAYGDQKYLSGL